MGEREGGDAGGGDEAGEGCDWTGDGTGEGCDWTGDGEAFSTGGEDWNETGDGDFSTGGSGCDANGEGEFISTGEEGVGLWWCLDLPNFHFFLDLCFWLDDEGCV